MKLTILIIILYIIKIINCQYETFFYLTPDELYRINKCKNKGTTQNVRTFSDCNTESDIENKSICCLVSGYESDGTKYRGCIAMNSDMFSNKTVSYESDFISGKVICDENYNSDFYYKSLIIFYINLFLVLNLF